jgi:hypothetical protein
MKEWRFCNPAPNLIFQLLSRAWISVTVDAEMVHMAVALLGITSGVVTC